MQEHDSIISPAEFDVTSGKWTYDHIEHKTALAGEAFGGRVSIVVMQELRRMFPDRNDACSNKPLYTGREVNRMIRAAIAQNYKKISQL